MAIFNVNQNRQFYVVTEFLSDSSEPSKEGQLKFYTSTDGTCFFKYYGKGGLIRTDIIDNKKITRSVQTTKLQMQRKLKKITVTLLPDVNEGNPIVGQDYILRIQVNNYLAPGDACVLIRSGAVHVTTGMDATSFYKKMADSLTMNFKRDPHPILKFESSAAGIVITEVGDQPWRLGVLSQEPVNFEVIPTTVRYEGEEVIWGKATVGEDTAYVGNGKQVADLEYFCMGERGDMFRNMGCPNNIDVKYMVDPSKEYDMLDIHYYYSGDGVQTHRSEKDLTFVSAQDEVINKIFEAVEGVRPKK